MLLDASSYHVLIQNNSGCLSLGSVKNGRLNEHLDSKLARGAQFNFVTRSLESEKELQATRQMERVTSIFWGTKTF